MCWCCAHSDSAICSPPFQRYAPCAAPTRSERIVLAAPDWLEPIVRMTGAVDALLPTDRLGALNWPGAPPSLAVNLHGRGPQSIADLAATRPGQLLTHRHRAFPAIAGLDWNCDVHEVDRWCRLLEFAEIPADRDDLALTVPNALPRTDTVVIHPGAGSPARQWPPSRYAEVAAHLRRLGWRVVVTGGRDETALAAAVCADRGARRMREPRRATGSFRTRDARGIRRTGDLR